jgi:RNA polymerase sigma factor (sigma-70 family)
LPQNALSALTKLLDHPLPVVRDQAIWALLLRFQCLPEKIAATIAGRLEDSVPEVRLGAALALRDRFECLPPSVLQTMSYRLRTERDRNIRTALTLALVMHRHDCDVVLPGLLGAMMLDNVDLRDICATLLGFSGSLPADERGEFAQQCLPRAFHPAAASDMCSAPEIVQSPVLLKKFDRLARARYVNRWSDFTTANEVVQALQTQFVLVAARTPTFDTSLEEPADFLDNVVRRVDSSFAYDFRSRFQGFAHRRGGAWDHVKVLPNDASAFQSRADALLSEAVTEHRELLEFLRAALDSLDADRRAIVIARFLDGTPWREIADRLNLPISTVQSQCAQAVRKLRLALPASMDLSVR